MFNAVTSILRRRLAVAAAFVTVSTLTAQPVLAESARNVILVHGAWADGSSWAKVVPLLNAKGFHVTAVQLPLTSLADDAATVKRAIALEDGPVVLVGHSYGGAVITEAGTDPKISALVYVAAFAPDTGESAGALAASAPPSPLSTQAKPDAQGFLKLSKAGVYEDFAQDLTPTEKAVLYAAQSPTNGKAFGGNITDAAWHSKPSWFIISANDRAIQPSLEAKMARTIKATTTTVASSHVSMLSHPSEVAEVIEHAAAR